MERDSGQAQTSNSKDREQAYSEVGKIYELTKKPLEVTYEFEGYEVTNDNDVDRSIDHCKN